MSQPLNVATLRSARKARKLSVEEVADFTRISAERLRQFEESKLEPSLKQLARLGELYNIAIYSFFSDTTPELDATLPDFRKARPTAADLSPRGLSKLWQVERRSEFVKQLVEALGSAAPKIAAFSRLTNRKAPSASVLRQTFNEWLQARPKSYMIKGDGEDIFVKHLRLFLETHGCLTTFNSAPMDDYLGFYKSLSSNSGVIFANRDIKNSKRLLFTLSHELAHFIYQEEGVSNPFVAHNAVEKKCNVFAASFLAPDDLMLGLVAQAGAPTRNDVGRLTTFVSSRSLLSNQASLLRLRDMGIVSQKAASDQFALMSGRGGARDIPSVAPSKAPMGRPAAIGRSLSEVGVYASYVASLALQKKLVDFVDVERGLGISEGLQRDVLDLAARRFEASVD